LVFTPTRPTFAPPDDGAVVVVVGAVVVGGVVVGGVVVGGVVVGGVVVGAVVVGAVVVLGVVVGLVVVGELEPTEVVGVTAAVGAAGGAGAGAGVGPQPNAAAASVVAAATRPSRTRRWFCGVASMTSPFLLPCMGVFDGAGGPLELKSHEKWSFLGKMPRKANPWALRWLARRLGASLARPAPDPPMWITFGLDRDGLRFEEPPS
jgi:hypothetical protein